MKHHLRTGLAALALLFVGCAVWADLANDESSLKVAREKRTASLRQVASDRTAVKAACGKKGTTSACSAAQGRYKSDLTVYRADEAAYRSAKSRLANHSPTEPSMHIVNAPSHHAGSAGIHPANVHH